MKKTLKILTLIGLAIASTGCTREIFKVDEKYEMETVISLENLNQIECVDDIELRPTIHYDAFIWSCDSTGDIDDGVFLNDDYEFFDFFANYDASTKTLSVNAYSPIMESMFSTKEEMERTILAEVITQMKRIQPNIEKKRTQEKTKENLKN